VVVGLFASPLMKDYFPLSGLWAAGQFLWTGLGYDDLGLKQLTGEDVLGRSTTEVAKQGGRV